MISKELLKYFKGDELAANVWLSKYAQEGEVTPLDMHKRMAKEFARIRWKKDKSKTKQEWYYYFLDLFDGFQKNIPQGRVMAGVGVKDSYRSLSNCLRLPPPSDSYSSIMVTDTMLVSSAKRGCGYGVGLSNLRPRGASTKNSSKTSTGTIIFGERYSNSTKEVGQEGRRGACLEDLDIRHPDSPNFAVAKLDKTKLTGANISFKMWNDFIKAVKNDEDYLLRFPCDQPFDKIIELSSLEYDKLINISFTTDAGNIIGYVKKIRARELWDSAIHTVWSDGCPGLQFWERIVNYDPSSVYKDYEIDGTNACIKGDSEILTKTGYKQIKEFVNEEVEIWNGFEWSKVIPRITGYNQHMLKITLSDGRELICTDYHKWYLALGYSGNSRVVQARNLQIGDKIIKYNFPVLEEGDYIDNKRAYTQGFISAEGMNDYKFFWIYEPKMMCKIRLDIRVEGSEFEIISGIKRQCIYYNGSYEDKDFVPFNWNLNSKLEWLSGLFDGDGTELKEGGLQLSSIDRNFLLDLQKLLSILGVNSKVLDAKEEGNKLLPDGKGGLKEYFCKSIYRICIGAIQVQNLKELGLKCERMSFQKTPQRDASQFSKIVKIEDVGYEDIVYCFNEPIKHFGVFNGILTGQCGEQPMAVYDTCRLLTQMLLAIINYPFTSKAEINYDKLYEYSYIQMEVGDDLIDLEIEYIQRIIDKIKSDPEDDKTKAIELDLWENVLRLAKDGRRVGGGITALADMLAALGVKYDSKQALMIVEQVMRTKFMAELDASMDLAEKYGTFKGWNPELEKNGNDWYRFVEEEFPERWKRMQKVGRRFVNWSTIAPVGTTSIISKGITYPNLSSGCEPQFFLYYFRNKKVETDNDPYDYIDETGIKWKQFPVIMGVFKDWWIIINQNKYTSEEAIEILENSSKEELDKIYEKSPWYGCTANDIDWKKRIEMQAILQKYTTSAISSTINLPKNVKEEVISEIYIYAWEKGLKGITCYRDGSKGGVLVHDRIKSNEFGYIDAIKRPKELLAESYRVVLKSEKYAIIVGLLNDKPYEVFGFNADIQSCYGKIIKRKKGQYEFISECGNHFISTEMSSEQAAITRLISTSLRHGADIKFIVEQLNKSEGDMFSFTKSIARVLKKYIPEGAKSTVSCNDCGSSNVIFEEGCSKCLECGSSRCG